MRRLAHLFLPLLALLLGGTSALAQDGAWMISEAKGTVLVIDARGQRTARAGSELAAGAMVRTEARASAVLVRGNEFVTLRQNAQLRIPEAARARSLVQIIQDYGSALFSIGKQKSPHFGVQTPYLAAVVKGTTFVITVTREAASLQVSEGAVEASTNDGGVRELIRPGTVAMIAAGDPLRMVIDGGDKRVVDSPARASSGAAAATPASAPGSSFDAAQEPAPEAPVATQPDGDSRIDQAVVSTPRDLGRVSNGFVGGEVAVLAIAAATDPNRAKPVPTPVGNVIVPVDDGAACVGGICAPAGSGGDKGQGNQPDTLGEPDKGALPDTDKGSDKGSDASDNADKGKGSDKGGDADDGSDKGKGSDKGDDADDGSDKGKGSDKGDDADDGSDKGKGSDSDKGNDDSLDGTGSDNDRGKDKVKDDPGSGDGDKGDGGNGNGGGNGGTPPGNGNPGTPPGNGNPGTPPGNGNPGTPPGNGNPGTPPGNGNPGGGNPGGVDSGNPGGGGNGNGSPGGPKGQPTPGDASGWVRDIGAGSIGIER